MLEITSVHDSLLLLLGHTVEEHFALSMLTRQVSTTAGPVLPAMAATSNTRQLASKHSS